MCEWTKTEPGYWHAKKQLPFGRAALVVASKACLERTQVPWEWPERDGYMALTAIQLIDHTTRMFTDADSTRDCFWTVFEAQRAAEQWADMFAEQFPNATPITVYTAPHKDAERYVALMSFEHNRRHINGWPIAMTSKIGSFLALVDTQGTTCYVIPDALGVSSDYNPGEIDGITVEYDTDDEPF